MRKCTLIFLLTVLIVFAVSCSNEKTEPVSNISEVQTETTVSPTPTPDPYPKEVLISNGDITIDRVIDGFFFFDGVRQNNIELKYNYQPRDVNIAEEVWTSSDDSVAKVSDKGIVTPVGLGTCTIDLHVSDGLSDGAYTSITVVVEDGIKQIPGEYPSYDTIFSYAENNLKGNADRYSYDTDENYNDTDDGFYYNKGDLSLMCSNKDSQFFFEYKFDEENMSQFDSSWDPHYFGEMDGMRIVVSSYRIDFYCDEYHFIAMGYDNSDLSSCFPLLMDIGFPNIADYFDWETIK